MKVWILTIGMNSVVYDSRESANMAATIHMRGVGLQHLSTHSAPQTPEQSISVWGDSHVIQYYTLKGTTLEH